MEQITVMKWPSDLSVYTFMHDRIDVKKKELETIMNSTKDDNIQKRAVRVGMIDMRWFGNGGRNFVAFSSILI